MNDSSKCILIMLSSKVPCFDQILRQMHVFQMQYYNSYDRKQWTLLKNMAFDVDANDIILLVN